MPLIVMKTFCKTQFHPWEVRLISKEVIHNFSISFIFLKIFVLWLARWLRSKSTTIPRTHMAEGRIGSYKLSSSFPYVYTHIHTGAGRGRQADWTWWYRTLFQVLERVRQEDLRVKLYPGLQTNQASLGKLERSCLRLKSRKRAGMSLSSREII